MTGIADAITHWPYTYLVAFTLTAIVYAFVSLRHEARATAIHQKPHIVMAEPILHAAPTFVAPPISSGTPTVSVPPAIINTMTTAATAIVIAAVIATAAPSGSEPPRPMGGPTSNR